MRVIKECEVEALYNRSLPLGFGLGMAAYLGVKRGIFKVELLISSRKTHKMIIHLFHYKNSQMPNTVRFQR